MTEEPGLPVGQPLSVSVSNAFVSIAAFLVPGRRRQEWKQEWRAEIWHRWQFLLHTGQWNRSEKLRLLRNSSGAFVDALYLLGRLLASLLAPFAAPLATPSDGARAQIRELARSPFSCLYVLAIPLLLIAIVSSGLPATRDLLSARSNASTGGKLLFIWLHPYVGGGDKGVPSDLIPAWASHSHLLEGVAEFNISRKSVSTAAVQDARPMLVAAEPKFFDVMGVKPAAGNIPQKDGIVLDHAAWLSLTHANPAVLGSKLHIAGKGFDTDYRVAIKKS